MPKLCWRFWYSPAMYLQQITSFSSNVFCTYFEMFYVYKPYKPLSVFSSYVNLLFENVDQWPTYVHLFNIDENCLFFKARLFRKIGAWLDTKPSIDAKSKFIWIASKQWWRAKLILRSQILDSALEPETDITFTDGVILLSLCHNNQNKLLSNIAKQRVSFKYIDKKYINSHQFKAILFQSLKCMQYLTLESGNVTKVLESLNYQNSKNSLLPKHGSHPLLLFLKYPLW